MRISGNPGIIEIVKILFEKKKTLPKRIAELWAQNW